VLSPKELALTAPTADGQGTPNGTANGQTLAFDLEPRDTE